MQKQLAFILNVLILCAAQAVHPNPFADAAEEQTCAASWQPFVPDYSKFNRNEGIAYLDELMNKATKDLNEMDSFALKFSVLMGSLGFFISLCWCGGCCFMLWCGPEMRDNVYSPVTRCCCRACCFPVALIMRPLVFVGKKLRVCFKKLCCRRKK